jgi:hypothetical protein
MEGLSESGFAIMVVLCIDSCIMNSLFFYLCWKGVYPIMYTELTVAVFTIYYACLLLLN